MHTRLRTALVVLAATIAGAAITARAEPTLRYNYDYVCTRGLRIVVGHCRHDSDTPGVAPTTPENDYCQVYYPDRSSDAMEMVLRGHLIESLQACGALGATTPGSNAKQDTAPAASPRAPPPAAAPSATATPASSGLATLSGPTVCDAIRHAGSLAAEEFRSVDLGPGHAMTETINLHKTSLRMPGADCSVEHERGKPNLYTCTWPHGDAAERQLSELAQTLKSCIGGQYEFHEGTGDVDPYAIARNAGVEYEAALNYDFVSLSIRPIKTAPAQASAGPPPRGPAAAPPSGRPPSAPMPIGPALCPLLRRLEALAREDFRSIDGGPDRSFGKKAETIRRTSMPIPGASCNIDRSPGEPVNYSCMWPQAKEKEVDDQFVNMARALKQCTGGTLDTTLLDELKIADVTVKLRGVEYRTAVINDFLSLDVHMAKP